MTWPLLRYGENVTVRTMVYSMEHAMGHAVVCSMVESRDIDHGSVRGVNDDAHHDQSLCTPWVHPRNTPWTLHG